MRPKGTGGMAEWLDEKDQKTAERIRTLVVNGWFVMHWQEIAHADYGTIHRILT